MKVEQIMSRPVISCRAHDTLNLAAGLMWQNDCGVLPVIDDDGAVIGMLTDRDICMAGYTTGRKLTAITVASAMAKKVVSCLPTDAIVEVEKLMASEQVRRLPVLDGHRRPIGIISLNDIARASAHISRKSAAEVASTMAAVCAPRRPLALQAV